MIQLTGLEGLTELWGETLGDPSVCVAVLDGPVDRSHPGLASARLECRETLVACRPAGGPATRHGTHVASIIFGRHGGPVAGIAPGCRGLILPIFPDGAGGAALSCSQISLARALIRAAEGGAHVVNISGGQFAPSGGAHPLLADAVRSCTARGILVVAAAGNDGCDCLHLPAALPNVLTVGALDRAGRPLAFSNWGAAYRSHGIMAPGESVPGAAPGGGRVTDHGTSYATAIVSGVAALLLSLQIKHGRPADPLAVGAALLETATGCGPGDRPGECHRLLAGRLHIAGAAARVLGGDAGRLGRAGRRDGSPHPAAVRPHAVAQGAVRSASGCRVDPLPLVYPVGQLSFDPGPRAGIDPATPCLRLNSSDPGALLDDLDRDPAGASSVVWTLRIGSVPAYAVTPEGAFAAEAYRHLRGLLRRQAEGRVEWVATPGRISGEATLRQGRKVPVVRPEVRGMAGWTGRALVESVAGPPPASREGRASDALSEAVGKYLDRISDELRNPGLSPRDRALNFGATHAASVGPALASFLRDGMALDAVRVGRSPFGRAGSDCWDVDLILFHSGHDHLSTRRVCRYTVDVAEVVPVLSGVERVWSVR